MTHYDMMLVKKLRLQSYKKYFKLVQLRQYTF